MKRYLMMAAILALAHPASVSAKGWYAGIDLHSSHVGSNETAGTAETPGPVVEEDGGGILLMVGYGFTPNFALRLTTSASGHETSDKDVDVALGSAAIEAVYAFRADRQARPYLFGGLGGFTMSTGDGGLEYEATGGGGVIGAGVLLFMNRHFAFDFAARGDFINWETEKATLTLGNGDEVSVETPVDQEGSAAKILFGGVWFF